MTGDSHQIIVTRGDPECPASSTLLVHHRVFPEIRAEGSSALAAADQLLQQLGSALDGTPNHWHRGDLQQALADVQAFLDEGRRTMAGQGAPG